MSIDGVKYPTHDDKKVYAYLPGDKSHTVRVGTSVTVYTYNADTSTWVAGLTLTAPAAAALVYDGESHDLITAGETGSGTMSYSSEKDGDYSETTFPTGKDAGTYEVWYKVTDGETLLAGPDCVEVKIARAPVTVTAADKSKDYGETDPALTYNADGLINDENLAGELTRAEGENVGTYAITQGTLTNENNPKTDGAEITAPAAADLTILTTAKLKPDGLRGKQGAQFTMHNTNIPTDLKLSFVSGNEGKFANLYKSVDGKLVFVTCAKIGADGSVVLPDIAAKGDYVAMLCEFSDRPGDMNNDGVMSAADASDILKQIIGAANGANPAVADMNGDGKVTAADASEILKKIVGLA